MRLNLDCVRQILLIVEENTGLRKYCFFIDSSLSESESLIGGSLIPAPDYQARLLKKIDNDELIYHINYCAESGLLSLDSSYGLYQIVVKGLTPKGHDFLENIRDNKIWADIKNIASNIGSKSLDSVIQISSNVITQLIKAHFGT